jgi:nitroimidazol reductase NimA-like FMN-containing flavoprotein (pyridoxamine 5'-phosphate oxidase superfamily)
VGETDSSDDHVVALSEAECFDCLKAATTGYLSTTDRALPIIVPVALFAREDKLLLAPVFHDSLSVTRDTVVALAIGELAQPSPHLAGGAWSVVVQGVLRAPASPSSACILQPELVSGWRRATVPFPC